MFNPEKEIAIQLAKEVGGYNFTKSKKRHACVILDKKGRILSLGFNQLKTHPIQVLYNKTRLYLHAETDAIRKLSKGDKRKAHTAIVCRVSKTGSLQPSFPCKGCYQALWDIQIVRIIFSVTKGWKEITI